LQKTLEDAPEQAADHAAVPEVVVNDGPQPMPYPGHIVPDDTPLAELLPPPPLLRTPEPPTPSNPSAVTPAHMLPSFSPLPAGEGTSPLPMIVESGEGPGGDAPPQASTGTVRPPAEATEHVPPARKKLRLDAVQTDKDGQVMFHHDEEVTIEGDVAEEYLECADASDGVDYDDSADLPEVPECLLRPFSETEPYCTEAELQLIDDAADEFEFKRLMQLGVMTEVEGRLPEHRCRERGWSLLALDVSDAFLQCSQHHATVTRIGVLPTEAGEDKDLDASTATRYRTSQPNTSVLEVCSDADWSGCKTTRKSVSSCAILWDNMLLYSHSKTQKVISLSSAESEYNSLVSAAAEGIFLAACIRFLIPEVELEVSCLVDNSAARSLACRQGVGKMRHISGKILWLQQCTRENVLTVGPIPTAENVSDIGTKPLKADRVDKLLGMLGIRCSNDGYALVGESHLLSWKERQRVCRVVKKGSLNMQQVMQVLAFVLQADRVTASTDEPNTSSNALSQEADDEDGTGYGMTIWNFLENLMYAIFLMCEFVTNHPYAIMLILQAFIVGAMCLQWCCSSRGGERS
ncbi:GIP, partial [Symbiodinium microadriaticum]